MAITIDEALEGALHRAFDEADITADQVQEVRASLKRSGMAIVPMEPTEAPRYPWDILNTLRDRGWAVAIHNDYWLSGERHTFWLFTHRSGTWVKGEGRTDAEALGKALKDADAWIEIRAAQEPTDERT